MRVLLPCLIHFSKQQEYDTNNVISRLTKNFSSLKRDFGEFLSLKGILNLPMIRYPLQLVEAHWYAVVCIYMYVQGAIYSPLYILIS